MQRSLDTLSAVSALQWIGRRLVDVANLGVDQRVGPESRRIQAINLSALAGLVLNTGFAVFLGVVEFEAMKPILIPDAFFSAGYLTTLVLSWRRRPEMAMWVLIGTMFLNLVAVGMFFGLTGGAWLYLILVPVLGALFVRSGNTVTLVLVVVGGSIAFALIASFTGEGPEGLQGTGLQSALFFIGALTTALVAAGLSLFYRRLAEQAEARSDWLLSMILPDQIAERLKAGESPIADRIPVVTILFADLVGSTPMADRMSPTELVTVLNELFSRFDDIADDHGLEKIKTGGDSYVAAAGLSAPRDDHAAAVADAALTMRDELTHHVVDGFGALQMRFGVHTGTVVAGVIGKRKFSYDLYGDAVNVASRMESSGIPNQIQVSAQVYELIRDDYELESRGVLPIKGKGDLETYLLQGRRSR